MSEIVSFEIKVRFSSICEATNPPLFHHKQDVLYSALVSHVSS